MTLKTCILGGATIFLLFCAGMTYVDFQRNQNLTMAPSRPDNHPRTNENKLLANFMRQKPFRHEAAENIKKYVDMRCDCSDFRLQSLLRMLYTTPNRLPEDVRTIFKETLLNFKYWMDEPGEDGMCYWSENHQILFAASEFLAGQLYPEAEFANSGLTGKQHKAKARHRILTWLHQRWLYGFVEWYSNVYYVEDIAPLSNLIDFADDDEIVTKSKIVMDLMMYDFASQSFRGTFVSSMGRSYEGGRKSGERASTRAITEKIFGYNTDPGERKGMDLNFLAIQNYDVPPVMRAIGRDTSVAIIKSSTGLNVGELAERRLIGQHNSQIMMQWAMEAFTNPPVIANSMKYITSHNMQANGFLYDFRIINYRLLRWFGLLPPLSRLMNPKFNGTAIQRANVYTYKTPYYSMYTAQSYHPGDYGDQHHVFGVTLSNTLSVFHNHPALKPGEKPTAGNSPACWVGYGRLPHSVQYRNVNLSIYVLPKNKGSMEKRLLNYTQFYCPREQFDTFILKENRLYVQHDHAFLAVIGYHNFSYDEQQKAIIQKGRRTFFICEAGSDADESFEQFVQRISANETDFDGKNLRYRSNGKVYDVRFGEKFRINGAEIDTQYPRFDSPYIQAKREPDDMRFQYGAHSLVLNFDRMTRTVQTAADDD